MNQKPLLEHTFEEFKSAVVDLKMPAFRAKQIWEWVFNKFVFSFDKMTNLSKVDIEKLKLEFPGILPEVIETVTDKDGTIKVVIKLVDGNKVEAVSIPNDKGQTFCLSTQIGCPVGCLFCRTGESGFTRNLSKDEILGQVLVLVSRTGQKPTNIVYMGMGEPFLNTKALFASIDSLTDPKGLGMATRRITISTSGVIEGIEELISRPGEVNLAISLHAADDETRNKLVPLNKKYSLQKLRDAVEKYIDSTSRRVSFEVTLLKNINDQQNNAMNLANFCTGLLCHVNIIRFNSYKGSPFKASSELVEREFKKVVKKAGIAVTIRKSRGSNILAACGQLSGKY